MRSNSLSSARRVLGLALSAYFASATMGCGSLTHAPESNAAGTGGSNRGRGDGAAAGNAGDAGSADAGAADAGLWDSGRGTCQSDPAPAQRLVRLTFSQLAGTITALLGTGATDGISLPGSDRGYPAFVPLNTPMEGNEVTPSVLDDTLSVLDAVRNGYLSADRFAALSGCAEDDDCIRQFLDAFAHRAFRRPLTQDERESILQSYAEMRTGGLGPYEAGPYAIEGILLSPAVLYRTEFGQPGAVAGETTLTPYEKANQLSYFLSNGPPDDELLQAAAAGELATSSGLAQQANRYLQMQGVRDNLSRAISDYYGLGAVRVLVKDPTALPPWSSQLADSMYAESQAFIANTLWQGTVLDQLISRRSFIDENLAALYGVIYPAAPGSGLVAVDLPQDQRSGVLTLAAWLATSSPVSKTAILQRGIWIDQNIVCGPQIPPEPAGPPVAQADAELDRAKLRVSTQPCGACHLHLDPYGMLLESYDAIGRFRTQYDSGESLAVRVDLPDEAGGGSAQSIGELVRQVTANGVFSTCLAASLIQYANETIERPSVASCAVKDTHDRFWSSDKTFISLIREVAASDALSHRSVGVP